MSKATAGATLKTIIGGIEKQFGKGAIMQLFGDVPASRTPAISTGSLGLDRALGIGGLPLGRLVEIYGPESSGKTTIALQVIAEAQRSGGLCAFIDAEHALDVQYAKALGVDLGTLLVTQPDYGEQALAIADHLIRTGNITLIVIDSVAALVPKAELEGDMGDVHVGLQARLMSQAMRKLTGTAFQHNTTLLFINQTRQKIGVTYGSNVTTTGGTALKFYASVRLEIARIGAIKEGDGIIGNLTRTKVVKNKVAPPFRQVEFEIIYGKGVNRDGELLDIGVDLGVIKKSGTWYEWNNEKLGQGRNAVCQWMTENKDKREEIFRQVVNAESMKQSQSVEAKAA